MQTSQQKAKGLYKSSCCNLYTNLCEIHISNIIYIITLTFSAVGVIILVVIILTRNGVKRCRPLRRMTFWKGSVTQSSVLSFRRQCPCVRLQRVTLLLSNSRYLTYTSHELTLTTRQEELFV